MEGACFNNSFIVEHTSAQAYVVVLREKADSKRNAALFFLMAEPREDANYSAAKQDTSSDLAVALIKKRGALAGAL